MPPPSAPSLTTFQYATSLEPTGNVYVMDGQSSITAASVTAFPTTALTVAFWVKTTATANQTLFRYGSGAAQLAIANPASVVVTLGSASTPAAGVAVNDGAWHHLAVTLAVGASAAVVRIFVDGAPVFQSSALAAGGGLQAAQTLVLGQAAATGQGFVGSLAEFTVWSSVLSAGAVASAMAVRQSAGTGVALHWSLASAQSVTGGTVQGGSFSPDAELVFRLVQTTATWTAVAGATYELKVTDDAGCFVLDQTGITGTSAPVPGVLLNSVYTAGVRAQVGSDWSDWSAPLSLTPLLLQPVLLDYDNATLSATWPAVDQEAQYAVSLYPDGSQTPTTTPQTARTLALSTQLAGQSTYGIVVQALTAGSLGPGNPSTQVAAPTFTFTADESGASPVLTVAWQPTTGAVRYYLTLTKQGASAPALAVLLDPSQTPYTISSSTAPYQNGDTWTAALRALGPGYIGAWAPAQTVTLTPLAVPALAFAWNAAGVDVTWGDVRTAAQQTANLVVTYDLQLLQDGVMVDHQENIANTAAARSYALSTSTVNRLAQDHVFAVKVRARAPGVVGPWNTPPTLAAPTAPTLGYDWAQANPVLVGWSAAAGAQGSYYEVLRQAAVIATGHVTGTSDACNPAISDGDTLSLQVRAFAAGVLGSYSTAVTHTVQQFAAPLITSLTATAATHTVAAGWTFQDPDAPNPTYTAQLWQGATQLGPAYSGQAASATFTNNAVADGATLTVQVRAAQGGNAGKWVQSDVTVTTTGTLGQVTGLTVGSNAAGDLSCSWAAVSGTGVTYTVQLLSGSSVQYTSGAVSGTSTTLRQTDTHVTVGSAYQVQVRAVQGSAQGPWSAAVTVTAGTPDPNTDPVQPVGGDPVNLATGAYAFRSTDLQTVGVFPLVFETRYATSTPLPSDNPLYPGPPLGPRWNHSYNTRIAVSGGTAYVIWGTGRVDGYTVPSSVTGAYTRLGAPDGSTLFLATTWVYTLTAADQSVYTFDRAGVLQSIASPAGNLQTLTYTGGQLTKVTDAASGRYLGLDYHSSGLLKSVTDNAGRSAQYAYTGGNLTSITDPLGKQQRFTYAANTLSLIETVTDQDGVTYLKNVYDGQNRVTFQQDGRALAAGASYGLTIGYAAATVNGLPGTLVTCTDAEGNVFEYSVVQANGATYRYVAYLNAAKTQLRRITYGYDGFGRVTAETLYEGAASDADTRVGNTTQYVFDANGNLQSTTTPNGLVTSTQWNAANLPVSHTDWLGNVTRWTYEGNLVKTETDPLGRVTTWSYRSGSIGGLPATVVDVDGNTTSYDYYAGGDPKTVTAPTGQVLYLESDTVGRTTRMENRDGTGAALRTTTLAYDAASRPLTVKLWLAGMTEAQAFAYTYQYDGVGRETRVTNPLGNATSYEFDANGLPKKVVYPSAAGVTEATVYDYFRNDFLKQVTYSSAVVESYTRDALGRPVTWTDPGQDVTGYAYAMVFPAQGSAPFQLSTTTTFPPAVTGGTRSTATVTMDPAGRVVRSVDAAGRVTTLAYAAQAAPGGGSFRQAVTTTLPPRDTSSTGYTVVEVTDAVGRPVSRTNEAGKTSTVAYTLAAAGSSAWNTVATRTDPLGIATVSTYDPGGRLVGWTTGDTTASLQLAYAYDAIDRVTAITQGPSSGSVATACSYAYQSASNTIRASVGRPGDATSLTTYDFNAVDQLVAVGYPGGASLAYGYSPRGQLASRTNARSQALAFAYDAAGRFTTTTLPDGTKIQQVLDGNGNRTATNQVAASVTTALITRTFDGLGRMTGRTDAVRNTTVGYAYDPTGLVTTLTYPDGKAATLAYDGMGRLHSVTAGWSSRVTTYTLDPTGRVTGIALPNGCATTLSFDAAGRLTGVRDARDGVLISSVQHTQLDALGQPTQSRRILPLAPADQAFTQAFTANAANQYLTVGSGSFAYDADGNATTLPSASGSALAYDAYNRLTSFGTASYTYDADSLRVSTTVDGQTRRWVYDVAGYANPLVEQASGRGATAAVAGSGRAGVEMLFPAGPAVPQGDPLDRALVVTDATGAVVGRYVYGLGLISQENADGSGLRVFHYDDAGNTVALSDESGNVTDAFAWDPYGRLTARTGASATPFLYAGRYGVVTDANGLAYMRARGYSPLYRRFLQRDALQGSVFRPQALNLYAYAGNQPLTFVDPLGLDRDDSCGFWCTVGKVVGGIVGAGIVGGIVYGIGYAAGLWGGAGAGAGAGALRPPAPGGPSGPAPRPVNPGPPSGARPPSMTLTNRVTGEQTFFFNNAPRGAAVEMDTYSASGGVESGLETEAASPARSFWQRAWDYVSGPGRTYRRLPIHEE